MGQTRPLRPFCTGWLPIDPVTLWSLSAGTRSGRLGFTVTRPRGSLIEKQSQKKPRNSTGHSEMGVSASVIPADPREHLRDHSLGVPWGFPDCPPPRPHNVSGALTLGGSRLRVTSMHYVYANQTTLCALNCPSPGQVPAKGGRGARDESDATGLPGATVPRG